MTKMSLDFLFSSLQPYLRIQQLSPQDVLQLIVNGVRAEQSAQEISRALLKKGVLMLERKVLEELTEDVVHPQIVSEIQSRLLQSESSANIRWSNTARKSILNCFFPRALIFQSSTVETARDIPEKIACRGEMSNPEKRNFCDWCIAIADSKEVPSYFGCFFSATARTSRQCRDQFAALFAKDAGKMLSEMTRRCADFLQNERDFANWSESKKSGLREVLTNVGEGFVDHLREYSGGESLMFPSGIANANVPHYKKRIRDQIENSAIPKSLAQIIASTAIILPVKPGDLCNQQEKVICSIWDLELTDSKNAWSKKAFEGLLALKESRHESAWKLFKEAVELRGSRAFADVKEVQNFADMLCCQAHLMMVDGLGVELNKNDPEDEKQRMILQAALAKMQQAWKIAYDNAKKTSRAPSEAEPRPYSPRSYYEYALYLCKKQQLSGGTLSENAIRCLDKAIGKNFIDAALLKAQILLTGAHGCEKDPAAAIALLENDELFSAATKGQKREQISMLAAYYAGTDNQAQAERYYEQADQLGSYEARRHLQKIHMKPADGPGVVLGEPNDKQVCLFNSDTAAQPKSMNAILHDSLSGEAWEIRVQDDLSALIGEPSFLDCGRIVFSLMSADEEKNLSDAIGLLTFLNNVAGQQKASVRSKLIDRIDVYLLNTGEACPLLLDAAMGNLEENVFFRVHLCDPDVFAANELLMRFPTFLPCISDGTIRTETWKGKNLSQRCKRRIVILGTNRAAEILVKQIIAATFLPGYPTELTVVGPEADAMQERFWEACPELDRCADHLSDSYIIPAFFQCELDRLPLNRTCSGSDKELQQILRTADYFAISGADDGENLALGVRLRQNLLRREPNPDRRPFIAVRYRDHRSAWIASQVAVSSRNYTSESGWKYRYHWSEDYDLHLFGSRSAFSHERLLNNYVERQALELHKSYYGTMYSADPAAEGDFYRRSYNRDSSIAAFIGVIYQCFGMGVYYPDPSAYNSDDHCALGEQYYPVLHDGIEGGVNEDAQEKAAGLEHARWRCFCASRGWSAPDEGALISYLSNGNPRHLLEIGLLHPYMVSYGMLPDMCSRINHLIEEHSLELNKLSDPCAPNRKFVQQAPALLGYIVSKDKAE